MVDKHLHSDNIFDIEVLQRSGIGVLPFVTLNDDLLYDSVQQQPVLNSVAASFIWTGGRGEVERSSRDVVVAPGQGSCAVKPLEVCVFAPHTILTRHLETVVQDGHKVRVCLCVSKPLSRQLKHLSCTFGVYVNLQKRAKWRLAYGSK